MQSRHWRCAEDLLFLIILCRQDGWTADADEGLPFSQVSSLQRRACGKPAEGSSDGPLPSLHLLHRTSLENSPPLKQIKNEKSFKGFYWKWDMELAEVHMWLVPLACERCHGGGSFAAGGAVKGSDQWRSERSPTSEDQSQQRKATWFLFQQWISWVERAIFPQATWQSKHLNTTALLKEGKKTHEKTLKNAINPNPWICQ